MKKKSFILVFAIALLIFPIVSAAYAQNSPVDIKVSCLNIDCNPPQEIHITIEYPNSTIVVDNETMDIADSYANYTFNQTSLLGSYNYFLSSSSGTPEYYEDSFLITSTGDSFGTGESIIISISIIIFILVSYLFFNQFTNGKNKLPVKWSYMFGSLLSFIAAINFISIFIGSASTNQNVVTFFDSFTSIMFIMLWFGLALLIIMWILSFFQTMFYKNLLNRAKKYGE